MTKLYAESFRGEPHLAEVLDQAGAIVAAASRTIDPTGGGSS